MSEKERENAYHIGYWLIATVFINLRSVFVLHTLTVSYSVVFIAAVMVVIGVVRPPFLYSLRLSSHLQ